MLAGRGFGKTRTGAEFLRQRVAEGARAIALIGPTAADVRDTMDQAAFGFRLGTPRGIITTTPRPTPVLKEILADPTVTVTRGSTFENAANLAKPFLDRLLRRYQGTRLGRQELLAQLLEDTPGALWTLGLFEKTRVHLAPQLARVAVAVDPQAAEPGADPDDENGAETGIIAGGVDERGDGYVVADVSGRLSPGDWGERTVLLHDELRADCIVGEVNNGGTPAPNPSRRSSSSRARTSWACTRSSKTSPPRGCPGRRAPTVWTRWCGS